jgi:hypothetical protein
MKLKEKLVFVVMGLLIFFFSGGVACTYFSTGSLNPVLVAIVGLLVFFTVGSAAWIYNGNKTVRQKAKSEA